MQFFAHFLFTVIGENDEAGLQDRYITELEAILSEVMIITNAQVIKIIGFYYLAHCVTINNF
jgi:hypothetical protein